MRPASQEPRVAGSGDAAGLGSGYLVAAALGWFGRRNGTALIRLTTAPLLRHCVQTWSVLFVPFAVVIRTRCRFGLNCRRVMPVIFVPTPPRYLALPRVVTWLPSSGPLPRKFSEREPSELSPQPLTRR